jgi:hypothetical protein
MNGQQPHRNTLHKWAMAVFVASWVAGALCLAIIWLPIEGKTWAAYNTAGRLLLPLAIACTLSGILWIRTKPGMSARNSTVSNNTGVATVEEDTRP